MLAAASLRAKCLSVSARHLHFLAQRSNEENNQFVAVVLNWTRRDEFKWHDVAWKRQFRLFLHWQFGVWCTAVHTYRHSSFCPSLNYASSAIYVSTIWFHSHSRLVNKIQFLVTCENNAAKNVRRIAPHRPNQTKTMPSRSPLFVCVFAGLWAQ